MVLSAGMHMYHAHAPYMASGGHVVLSCDQCCAVECCAVECSVPNGQSCDNSMQMHAHISGQSCRRGPVYAPTCCTSTCTFICCTSTCCYIHML